MVEEMGATVLDYADAQGYEGTGDAAASSRPQSRPKRAKKPKRANTHRHQRSQHAHLNQANRYALTDLGLLHVDGMTPTALRVCIVLASHANQDRGTCFPTEETIGRETGIRDTRQVRKALALLEKLGLIRRDYQIGRATLYWLSPPPSYEDVADSRIINLGGSNPPGVTVHAGATGSGTDSPGVPGTNLPGTLCTVSPGANHPSRREHVKRTSGYGYEGELDTELPVYIDDEVFLQTSQHAESEAENEEVVL